tara:strand:+ start:276 stop:485 length:210 start_codon:yes stop_codon:yes gene_type:complete
VKKSTKGLTQFEKKEEFINETQLSKNKTTNVNILLNRVRLDKKKELRKKLIFIVFFTVAISSLVIFVLL